MPRTVLKMKKDHRSIKICRRHSALDSISHQTHYTDYRTPNHATFCHFSSPRYPCRGDEKFVLYNYPTYLPTLDLPHKNSSAANCLGGAASFPSIISNHCVTLHANKKSQIKMFENIAVLIVFMFLLVFGANFYFFVQQNGIQKQAAEFRQLDAINVALNTLLLPELDCNFLGHQQQKCFDREKVRQFITLIKGNRAAQHYYENVLGTANITINILYPTKENITLYENIPSNITKIGGIKTIQIPLIICEKFCDRINGEPAYSFAYINVEAYQRKT